MTNLIVDASVAVKWFFDEDGSDAARAILDQDIVLFAPELILAEVGNAAWKRRVKRQVEIAEADFIIERIPALIQGLAPLSVLAKQAIQISMALPHPAYDCFYLALAERERLPIVTADGRLLAAARKLGTIEARPL
jgi:predicted nucleic acid-binding protein